jgi:hypothetical protein
MGNDSTETANLGSGPGLLSDLNSCISRAGRGNASLGRGKGPVPADEPGKGRGLLAIARVAGPPLAALILGGAAMALILDSGGTVRLPAVRSGPGSSSAGSVPAEKVIVPSPATKPTHAHHRVVPSKIAQTPTPASTAPVVAGSGSTGSSGHPATSPVSRTGHQSQSGGNQPPKPPARSGGSGSGGTTTTPEAPPPPTTTTTPTTTTPTPSSPPASGGDQRDKEDQGDESPSLASPVPRLKHGHGNHHGLARGHRDHVPPGLARKNKSHRTPPGLALGHQKNHVPPGPAHPDHAHGPPDLGHSDDDHGPPAGHGHHGAPPGHGHHGPPGQARKEDPPGPPQAGGDEDHSSHGRGNGH